MYFARHCWHFFTRSGHRGFLNQRMIVSYLLQRKIIMRYGGLDLRTG